MAAGGSHTAGAWGATATLETRVRMSDGISLAATVSGRAPLTRRPVIVEFSPYGNGSGTTADGAAYNYLLVQIRGTGSSDGQFDALGPRTQRDVAESLGWACRQPWSDGRLGLNGFSASAITIYNSLHLPLPCVRTAVLRSGTFELYRDLLWPGGISNTIPGLGVLGLIGAPALLQGGARLQRAPLSSFDTAIGLIDAGLDGGLVHPTLDQFWRQRGFRGEVNHLPILMLDSFFDVESRGAFQAYQALKRDGAHLLVVGAHDGAPARTDDGNGANKAWFDRHLLGVRNRVERQPRVQTAAGRRQPRGLPRRRLRALQRDRLADPRDAMGLVVAESDPQRDCRLDQRRHRSVDARPATSTTQTYAAIPTLPTTSDQPNIALLGAAGLNQVTNAFPLLTQTALSEPEALTYTTPPLASDLLSAGPVALDVHLSSTAPETSIWAVIADVWPDGTRIRSRPGGSRAPIRTSSAAVRSPTTRATSSSPPATTRPSPTPCRRCRAPTNSSSGRSATASGAATASGS